MSHDDEWFRESDRDHDQLDRHGDGEFIIERDRDRDEVVILTTTDAAIARTRSAAAASSIPIALSQTSTTTSSTNTTAGRLAPPPARSKYKLVFLGTQSVGKSALITRYIYDTFDPTYRITLGIDFVSKSVLVPPKPTPSPIDGISNPHRNPHRIRLQIWDSAGQERFRSLIPSYIRDCSIAIIVYDVTERNTYLGAFDWLKDVRSERGEEVMVMLVGNKCDLEAQRQVSTEEAMQMATETGLLFKETSAKLNINVQEMFDELVAALPIAIEEHVQDSLTNSPTTTVILSPMPASTADATSCISSC